MKLRHLVGDLAQKSSENNANTDVEKADRILATCFPKQKAFITDRCRRKSALCSRRSGKTYSCLVSICEKGLRRPGSNIVYIALTRGQAKKNLWRTFKKFNDDFELGLRFHETNLTATFPNGSVVSLVGCETLAEAEKLRGDYYDLVIIDEGKSFQDAVLIETIEEILWPALADNFGTLMMIGTPGNVLAGVFYEATSLWDGNGDRRNPARPASHKKNWPHRWVWSFHSWHVRDNTAMPHIWEYAFSDKKERGIPDDDPVWRREWMSEWCASESLTVYHWNEKCAYDGTLPDGHEWRYLLGLDLGFNDSTAITVAAYSDTYPEMFQVYEWKKPGLIVDQIEKQVRVVMEMYSPEVLIGDTGGLGKTIIETLVQHGIPIEAARKTDKLDHIELVNSDLRLGRMRILAGGSLEAEMKLLQWEDDTYRKEDKRTDNHLCDSWLYLCRYAYHHFWEPAEVEVPKHSTEWFKQWDEEQAEKAAREAQGLTDDLFGEILFDQERDPWMN